jgi:voltage-gated potassium channel
VRPLGASSHLGILRLPEGSLVPPILRRTALAIALVLLSALFLWLTCDGLRDSAKPDSPIQFTDILYFTVVSLTTVGYGDIAPVTTESRLLNTFLLTPVRIFIWILFLGTAYELALLRFRFSEEYRMKQLRERLEDHVIVAGFGVKGRAIVDELLAHGHVRENIVIIDPDEDAVAETARRGLVGLRGDASTEALLRAAAIEKAAYMLVAPNRDDASVLMCLTVRNLAPNVYLVAATREEENVKLLYRAGANLVVSPSVSGGRLMAAAVRQHAVPHFLEDLLTFGHGVDAAERTVQAHEAGMRVPDLRGLDRALVLGVMRNDERCPFYHLAEFRLQAGDVVVYLTGGENHREPS